MLQVCLIATLGALCSLRQDHAVLSASFEAVTAESTASPEGRKALMDLVVGSPRSMSDDRYWEGLDRGQGVPARDDSDRWAAVLGVASPPISKRDLVEIIHSKRNSLRSFASRCTLHWWSESASGEARTPPAGIDREYWWSPSRQMVSVRYRDNPSSALVRVDTVGDGVSALRTERDYIAFPPAMSTRVVSIEELYALDEPFIQAGIVQAASFRAEPKGTADLVSLLERKSTVVLPELAQVFGRACVVIVYGSPPLSRAYLSIEDDFLPIRVEHFASKGGPGSHEQGRKLVAVLQVLATRKLEGYFSIASRTAYVAMGRGTDTTSPRVTMATLTVVQTATAETPLPPVAEVLDVDSGTIIADEESGLSLERVGEQSTLGGALRQQLAGFRVPPTRALSYYADLMIAGAVVCTGVLGLALQKWRRQC